MIGDSPYLGIASLFGKQQGLADFDVGLYDARQKSMMTSRDDVKDIRVMHLTQERIVIVCRVAALFYDLTTFQRIGTVETSANDAGVCCFGRTKVREL